MNIDVDSFRFIWDSIETKLDQISKIPKLYSPNGRGKDFIGYEIDSSGVTHKSETYNYGETEPESFKILWHEINNPLSYFEEKYSKEIAEWNALRKQENLEIKRKSEEVERRLYESLRLKFESQVST